MQVDVLLGIRGNGVCYNLEHKFRKSICIIVQLAIFGFHEQYVSVYLYSICIYICMYVQELLEPR